MANKWVQKLMELEGSVIDRTDPFRSVLKSSSPSVNFTFGRTHGLPFGYSLLLWGEPKAGKSLLTYDYIGSLHRLDPEAIAIRFDTEFRDQGQLTPELAKAYGIDMDRYIVYQVNDPSLVFDKYKDKIEPMLAAGCKIRLVAFDSINGILGRREIDSKGVGQHNIGDHAQTMQIGLKMLLPIQRKYKIAHIITAQARAEMDMWEAKRSKTKAAVSFGVRHLCEYNLNVEKEKTAASFKDEEGNSLIDENRKGLDDQGEQTGHHIVVWMQDSSVGPKGRVGKFTFDYKNGIINTHEEIFKLAVRWNLVERPTNQTYEIADKRFNGRIQFIQALKENPQFHKMIMDRLFQAEAQAKIKFVPTKEETDIVKQITEEYALNDKPAQGTDFEEAKKVLAG